MSSFCINKNTAEFQTLLKQSGLPEFYVSAVCGEYLEKYDRFPYLDEIRGSDSSKYLQQQLNIKHRAASIEDILNMTGKETLQEAQIYLNQNFRDIEVEFLPLGKEAIVYITKRPETKEVLNSVEHSSTISSSLLFENIINRLVSLYGIQVNAVNNETVTEIGNIPGIVTAKAFVYNGQIYVNTDLASKDAPIHEMMHILMGSLRSSNPDLYFQIANWVSTQEVFNYYKDAYPNRTMSDVAEEAFVGEFAKLVTSNNSSLQNFPNKIKYELFYNAKRVLDSILMGESSVRDYSDTSLFTKSLSALCKQVNSSIDVNKYMGTISLHNGEAHRILANKKQELFENKELEEYCNA